MKLQIASDIHLGISINFDFKSTDSDVLILPGDIAPRSKGIELAEKLAASHGKPVLYVAGNHEYYHTNYPDHLSVLREKAAAADNVFFLENDVFEYQNVRFIGTTLWTDYRLDGRFEIEDCMRIAGAMLNDHRYVKNGDRYFEPADALAVHQKARAFLKAELEKPYDGKTVVVTHHAPSMQCEHPLFGINTVAAAFMSDCESLMKNADLWIFGHTHANKDFYVGDCHVISNQVGYTMEKLDSPYRPDLVVEV